MPLTLEPQLCEHSVGMGQIVLVGEFDVARATLGSCLGISLYDERKKMGALAHVLLATSSGRAGSPGKFVDTAVTWMLERLVAAGADARRICAKLTGGSNMFSANGPFRIGQQNADSARIALRDAKIRIVGEHLGGSAGRRVTFRGSNGSICVEIAGSQSVQL